MSVVEPVQPPIEEDSFIILGTSPTPSMDNLASMPPTSSQPASVVERQMTESVVSLLASSGASKMETSTQLDSATFSLLGTNGGGAAQKISIAQQPATMSRSHESSTKSSMIASTESTSTPKAKATPKSLQSIENKENIPRDGLMYASGTSQMTTSFILGETQSILHQFPSLAQSSVSCEEIQMLQKLSQEHTQLKDSLQRANVAMRKNFASIQLLQDETKARCDEQESLIQELQKKIEQLTAENDILTTAKNELAKENEKLLGTIDGVRTMASQKGDRMEQENEKLRTELDESTRVRDVERTAAQIEVDELRKESSERQAIIQNLAKRIEDLELQGKGFVVVNNNKPEKGDLKNNFVPLDVHQQKIKDLERRMSVEVAKNLEFEDMRKLYVDEINCLKANLSAAEQVYGVSRVEAQQHHDAMKKHIDTIEQQRQDILTLQERIQVLGAQSDIFQKDFEAERTAREELASEKSRILSEFEVLQRRNVELTTQISQTEKEREETVKRAAMMVQEATSEEGALASVPVETKRQEPLSILRCPLCLKAYNDFGSLQSHAADCMGIE